MNARPRSRIVASADLARFFLAFGVVPLLLVSDSPPWSFVLVPTWSVPQLAFIAVAGVGFGLMPGRPAPGLAAVTLGSLLGLAADLWWLAGWVEPYDQAFVTTLPVTHWRSSLIGAALSLVGLVAAGFVLGASVSRLVRTDRTGTIRRPSKAEPIALGIAIIGAPLLAVGIASAAASSALVVPDGVQIQTVFVSAGAIAVDPASLRPGPTRFRCEFALDATPEWARLVARPEGVAGGAAAGPVDDFATCGAEPGRVAWGTVADLEPGRYVWTQIEPTEVPRVISTSPVFLVGP